MHLLPIFILFLSGIILTLGDLIFKTWIEKGSTIHSFLYIFGIISYLIGSMLLVESYKHDINIALAGIIQIVFNTIILLVFTYLYFNEPITLTQVFGIITGIFALYLLS